MQYIDMHKQIINVWNIMKKTKNHHVFNIGIKISYIVG